MKKTLLSIVFVAISFTVFSQTSSGVWDSRTATYFNSEHKITWRLIDDLEWVERPILVESTLLKVRNYDTELLVSLGADKYNSSGMVDSWDYLSEIEFQQKELFKQLSEQSGLEYVKTEATKSQLCGLHAIKIRSDSRAYNPESGQIIHYIEITYGLFRRGYIYTMSVAVFVLEEEIADFDRIATMIFNGFKIS